MDICRTAEAMQATLVILGAHKPLWLEGDLGGTVRDVVVNAKCRVGVFIDRGLAKVSRVLVAISAPGASGPAAEDAAALEVGAMFASAPGTAVTVLEVAAPGEAPRAGKARAYLERILARAHADPAGVGFAVSEHESPPDAVARESQGGYDLVVLGMRAAWGFDTSMLSLTRRRALAESPASILVVHSPAAAVADTSSAHELAAVIEPSST